MNGENVYFIIGKGVVETLTVLNNVSSVCQQHHAANVLNKSYLCLLVVPPTYGIFKIIKRISRVYFLDWLG